jgi:hypothetical protein
MHRHKPDRGRRRRRWRRRRRRVSSLPDDLIAEILERVPYRLLCRFKCDRRNTRSQVGSRYFVCNPATEKWTELPSLPEPTTRRRLRPAIRLGFDPAASSHFRFRVFVTSWPCTPRTISTCGVRSRGCRSTHPRPEDGSAGRASGPG